MMRRRLWTALALAAASARAACPGDCDLSGAVGAHELAAARDALLQRAAACAAADPGGDGIDLGDVVRAVSASYRGCRLSECAFAAGALAADTLEPGSPVGAAIPVDHVVWVMQENRSFDHYFGTMEGVDGLREGMSNEGPSGPVAPFHETDLCTSDVDHSWNGTHRAWNGGLMDRFVAVNGATGARAMAHYDESDLPYYRALAAAFATSDRHFCSVLGPTFPNRYFLYCGTAFGKTANDVPLFGWTQRTVLDELTTRGITWRVYSDGPAFANAFRNVRGSANLKPLSQFFTDAAAGSLRSLSIVDPAFTGVASEPTDEHPPSNIQAGQAHVASVVGALMSSPQWASAALFYTYDEHGGYFDHVAPPPACVPDARAPELGPGDVQAGYDTLGIRVPLIVVSPWARRGYVSRRASDLTSVLRFLQARFGLPAMTARDANALALLDMFDFDAPPRLAPPALPPAIIESDRGCP